MTVNPKKLRPYDTPPKRRRELIPDRPDSAATGFLVAAALWLAIATGLGALAIGLRIVDFQFAFPLGVFDLGFQMDETRVDYAFVNATVFGWLSNAGFAAVAFMTPRLTGRPMAMEGGLNVALAIWNLSLLGGIAALYIFDLGPDSALTAMPWLFEGGLALGALIVTGAFFATAATSLRTGYISTWFAAVALLSLLGLTGVSSLIGIASFFFRVPDLAAGLASVFIGRSIVTLWLLGMTFAILHYVVPRSGGVPLAWGGLAMLTWLTWLVLAPLSGLGELIDVSVPYAITTLGSVATMLLFVPVVLATVNLVQTMRGRWTLLFGIGTAAFAAVSLAFLFATSLVEGIHALRSVRTLLEGTDWIDGAFMWAAYGAFTFAALALAEHALPRLLRRAWGGGFLSGAQLWLAFGGAVIAGIGLMGAGLAEGAMLGQGTASEDIAATLIGYRAVALAGFGLVGLAALAHVANLFLMYTSGEPIDYVVPGTTAPAAAGH